MKVTHQILPKSRIEFRVELTAQEVAEYYAHAVDHMGSHVKVAGFRPGKAPADIVRSQLKEEALREEAFSIAARQAWTEVTKQNERLPIQDPEVDVESFSEGREGVLVFRFDFRPEVKLGNYQKIRIKPVKAETVTDEEVESVILSLLRANAIEVLKSGSTEAGDKIIASFTGSVNNVRNNKLTANNFPIVLGQGSVIPGFEEQLVGATKGDKKSFELDFPAEHFDKELAGKKVKFEVEIVETYKLILPERDDEFAQKFGHQTYEKLVTAIREDLQKQKNDEADSQQKAKWLSEFEKVINVEIPASLIANEVERSRQSWRSFLMERGLSEQDWLSSRQTSLQEMESGWQQAAESSVRIGLGLAEISKLQGQELKSDEDYKQLLERLVEQAIK